MDARMNAEFKKLGCENRRDMNAAFYVYLELCEVKKYRDVEYFYNSDLKRLYFTGRKNKTEPQSIFVPISIFEYPSFNDLQSLFQLRTDKENEILQIVLVDSDSTCVYYQITDTLIDPAEVEKRREDSRNKIDVHLEKNREYVEEAAKYGISIRLPMKQPDTTSAPETNCD